MPKPVDSRTTYIPALDGLRTIAVMAVLFYHLGASWAPGGLLGVAVFFTLSGYLISTNLLRAKYRHDTFRLSTFWLRRFRRLVPAVVVTVAAVFLVTALSTPGELGDRVGESISSLLYVNNWYVIAQGQSYFDQFESTGPLDHMWSLSIEEQFYLVWPLVLALLFALFGRRKRAKWLIGAATLALATASFWWMAHLSNAGADATRIYEGTDTRAGGQAVDLGAELVEILEAAIDGGEADIGDLVEALQGLHHLLADDPGVDLPLAPGAQGLANALHRGLNGLGADRALLQGAKHAGAQLLLVEGLPGAVTLDDSRHHQLRGLVGGEALAAGHALAAPPHLVALGDQPRVGDLGVMGSAEGAVHGWVPGRLTVSLSHCNDCGLRRPARRLNEPGGHRGRTSRRPSPRCASPAR